MARAPHTVATVTFLVLVAALAVPAHAAEITWKRFTGSFNSTSRWVGGVVPGSTDVAIFDGAASGSSFIEVTFSSSATTQKALFRGDPSADIFFTLNNRTYTVTSTANQGARSLTVGENSGDDIGLSIGNGPVNAVNVAVGLGEGSRGSLRLTKLKPFGGLFTNPAILNISGKLTVGELGVGDFTIEAGNTATVGSLEIGDGFTLADGYVPGGSGTVTVTGAGASLINTGGQFEVGSSIDGTLNIMAGGFVQTDTTPEIGTFDGTGRVLITGASSKWLVNDQIFIGAGGNGELKIENGGLLESDDAVLGSGFSTSNATGGIAPSSGDVLVTGGSSRWEIDGSLHVGQTRTGNLRIEAGGKVTNGFGLIGINAPFEPSPLVAGESTVTVTGAGSQWINSGGLLVGIGNAGSGSGFLNVEAGGFVSNDVGQVGNFDGNIGTATVTGTNSLWQNQQLFVGLDGGDGTLTVANGGKVTFGNGQIGGKSSTGLVSGIGAVTVTGGGSRFTASSFLTVGGGGTLLVNGGAVAIVNGELTLVNGGTADSTWGSVDSSNFAFAGAFITADSAAVSGDGSRWDMNRLIVGRSANGTLTVSDGGHVEVSARGFIGEAAGSNGQIIVGGAGAEATLNIGTGGLFVGGNHLGGNGTGTLTVNTGGTANVGGELKIWNNGTVTVNGGTLETNTLNGTPGTVSISDPAGGSALTIGINNGTSTFGGLIQNAAGGPGSLKKAGAGTLTLSGNNTYTGGTRISGGVLEVSENANLGANSSEVLFSGGTLRVNNPSLVTFPTARAFEAVNSDVKFEVSNQSVIVNGPISGNGGLVKNGPGTLRLDGAAATYTGSTTVNGGRFRTSVSDILPNTTDVTINGGEWRAFGATQTIDTLNGVGTLLFRNSHLILGSDGGTGNFSGNIGQSGGVTGSSLAKIGSGTQTLSGSGSYQGGTTVSGGTLVVNTNSLPAAGGVVNNAILKFDQGSDGTYSGVISGSGTFLKTGGGTLTLSGANTYTLTTDIFGGVLDFSDNANLGANTAGIFFGGGTLRASGSSTVTLPAARSLFTGSAGAELDSQVTGSATWIIDGVISGSAGLDKTGPGTLTLSGNNTYTGGTTINAGTLITANTTGSATGTGGVTINSGGTLGGTGSAAGMTTVKTGGTLAPGTSVGALGLDDAIFESNSTYAVELAANGGVAGTDFDQVAVTANVSLEGELNITLLGGFVPEYFDEFEILVAGSRSGKFDDITGALINGDMTLAPVYDFDGNVGLTLVAAIPGDANLDGIVNGLDLLTWQSNLFSGDEWNQGDFNLDGLVNGLDLLIWQSHLFNSVPVPSPIALAAATDVPEPSTAAVLLLLTTTLTRRRKP